MKKAIFMGLFLSSLILSQSASVLADNHKSSGCSKRYQSESKCKVAKLKSKLKLLWDHQKEFKITPEQIDQIKDIKHEAIKKLIQHMADKEIVKVDLKSAMWEDVIDLGVVNSLIDAKYAAKSRASKTYAKAISDVQNVLTEDQRTHWREAYKAANCAKGDCDCFKDKKICPITGKVKH